VTASPEQLRQASDPATPGAVLGELAAAHADLHTAIALNPATYPGLLDWLRQYGAPEVQDALARRASAPPPPPPPSASPPPPPVGPPAASYPPANYPPASQPGYAYPAAPGYAVAPGYAAAYPRAPFVEPSRSAPLTWGDYDGRYRLALVAAGLAGLLYVFSMLLLFSGAYNPLYDMAYATNNNYVLATTVRTLVAMLPILAVGAAIVVIPARDTPRLIALSVLAIALLVTIGQWADWPYQYEMRFTTFFIFASIVAAWFIVRERPSRSFAVLPVLLIPAAVDAFVFYDYYDAAWLLFVLLFIGSVVGTAWLGRAVAASTPSAPLAPTSAG
jgi:hypothetical protein